MRCLMIRISKTFTKLFLPLCIINIGGIDVGVKFKNHSIASVMVLTSI